MSEQKTVEAVEPKTHDYTKPRWGHDCCVNDVRANGRSISLSGWGRGIKQGDYLILNNEGRRTTRYQVYEIHYYSDPSDMWRADARFTPRENV